MKVKDLQPDSLNANKGTLRGHKMLEKSLRTLGAGRSILLDKHGRIIAGNKTAEIANDIGLDDVIEVHTDGTKLVAVVRDDLDLTEDPRARELAYADNRVGQVDLDFDTEQLLADIENQEVDLSWLWSKDDVNRLMGQKEFKSVDLEEIDLERLPERPAWCLLTIPYEVLVEAKQVIDSLSSLPGVQIEYSGDGQQ